MRVSEMCLIQIIDWDNGAEWGAESLPEPLESHQEWFVVFRVAVLVIAHADNGALDRKLLPFCFRLQAWKNLNTGHNCISSSPSRFLFQCWRTVTSKFFFPAFLQ